MILLLAALLMSGCAFMPGRTQTVSVGDFGRINIPHNWTYSTEDSIMYILDEKGEPVLIELQSMSEITSNKYCSAIEYLDTCTSAFPSNGVLYGTCDVVCAGYRQNMWFIDLPDALDADEGFDDMTFLVWDKDMTQRELMRIVLSYYIIE